MKRKWGTMRRTRRGDPRRGTRVSGAGSAAAGIHTWKATEEETGGAFLLFEDVLGAGKVTPLHPHPEAEETFYMLEGEIVLHIDGQEQRLWHAGGLR